MKVEWRMTDKKTYFLAGFGGFALLFSYHAFSLLYETAGAAAFAAFLIIIPGIYFLLEKSGLNPDEKKDRLFVPAAAALACADILLSFMKSRSVPWMCAYNIIPALAVAAVFIRAAGKTSGAERGLYLPVTAAAAAALAVFSALFHVSLHRSFFTFTDLSIFTNVLWSINNNEGQFTMLEGGDHRGVHFQPVIYLLALLFRAGCGPEALLAIQPFFIFGAALFLFLLAEKILENRQAAFLVSMAFLCSPYAFRNIYYDYHPETMYMAAFFAFLYFAESKKMLTAALAACFALLLKEETGLYICAASVFLFMRGSGKKYLLFAAVSAAYAATAVLLIMPAYGSGTGGWLSVMAGNIDSFAENYMNGRLALELAVFFCGMFLLSLLDLKAAVFIVLPVLLVHLLRFSREFNYVFDLHYASFAAASGFGAAVYGLKKAADAYGQRAAAAAGLGVFAAQAGLNISFFGLSAGHAVLSAIMPVLAGAAVMSNAKKAWIAVAVTGACLLAPVAGFFMYNAGKINYVPKEEKDSIAKALKTVPDNSFVASNMNILPRLSSRKYVMQVDSSSAAQIITAAKSSGLPDFYLVSYMRDFTYSQAQKSAEQVNEEISRLAMAGGYAFSLVYGDGITAVARFYLLY